MAIFERESTIWTVFRVLQDFIQHPVLQKKKISTAETPLKSGEILRLLVTKPFLVVTKRH